MFSPMVDHKNTRLDVLLTTSISDGIGSFFPFCPSGLNHPLAAWRSFSSPMKTRINNDTIEVTMAQELAVARSEKKSMYVCLKMS